MSCCSMRRGLVGATPAGADLTQHRHLNVASSPNTLRMSLADASWLHLGARIAFTLFWKPSVDSAS